jgi:Leucine-rich repeat (LRR) protein
VELNCAENEIRLEMLKKLPAVQTIDISHNRIRSFPLEMNGFRALRTLNLSFNSIEFEYLSHLAMMPELRSLNIGFNDLKELPEDMSNFELLESLDLSGNMFSSEYKAAMFWGTLATIPQLNSINISRNKMRGIHTERLSAGNFSTLQVLDFSFNNVENQHNLICARNFTELKKLIVTGNPFAVDNEYKGLEMEIYARTGAELIVEPLNQYYLKK